MTAPRKIAVIDIGKTNAKLALVDLAKRSELVVTTRPNRVLPSPPYPHFDTEGIWQFLLDGLADFQRNHGIDAVSVTTHGACAALLDADGQLAAPVLDYEHDFPPDLVAAYDALRPGFAETGSPRLAHGLNLGAQLHHQFATDPGLHARTARILTWPQYWAHRLTGVAATDVTSLGCHTDLWNPTAARFSSLVDALDIRRKIAPPLRSDDVLGFVLPAIAAVTGLRSDTPVACGIHDSNASLFPYLHARKGPFSVVSTGTWVIAMTMGGTPVTLDPARDTLVNVNALGQPVPSARFMGGRESEMIRADGHAAPAPADVRAVLERALFLLPAVDPTTGPFQHHKAQWTMPENTISPAQRDVALSFYLALMTAECLHMTGAAGPVIIEGPFARDPRYLEMLSAATGLPVTSASSETGTAIGAAMLFCDRAEVAPGTATTPPISTDPTLVAYARNWRAAIDTQRSQKTAP
jgi:sugar (pentulose or hexulose) kinase